MLRLLFLLGLATALAFGAVWLADRPGEVTIVWSGLRIETSVAVAAIGLLALIALGMALWSLLRFVLGLPTAFSFASRARRRERGIEAVSRGMVAVGAGDPAAARRHAADARKLITGEPLALLLAAQAAQLNGDKPAAEAAFKAMLDEPDTRILGLRGLFVEARRRGDQAAAQAFADEAVRLSPSLAWANDALLEHHTAAGDWSQARIAVERRASLRLADKNEARRHRAVLLAAEALAVEPQDQDRALMLAAEAIKLAPGLTPAAALAARLHGAKGDLRRAARIVEAAWREQPHPDLAAVYLRLRPGDSAADRLARAESLLKLRPLDPESAFAVAEAAIAARDFARARAVLAPLVAAVPTMRTCLLMAELEDAEHGSQGRAREWLTRSTRAPRDNAWVADGLVSRVWLPVSPVSGRLDAFAWTLPPAALGAPALEQEEAPAPLIEPTEVIAPAAAPVAMEAAREALTPAPDEARPSQAPAPSPAQAVGADEALAPPPPAGEVGPVTAQPARLGPDLTRAPDDPGPDPSAPRPRRGFWSFLSR